MDSKTIRETIQNVKYALSVGDDSKITINATYKNGEIQTITIDQGDQTTSVKITLTESEFSRYFQVLGRFVFGIGPVPERDRKCNEELPPIINPDTVIPQTFYRRLAIEIFIVLTQNSSCIFHFKTDCEPDAPVNANNNEDFYSNQIAVIVGYAQGTGMQSASGVINIDRSELHFQEGKNILIILKTPADLRLESVDELHDLIHQFINQINTEFETVFKEKLSKDFREDLTVVRSSDYAGFQVNLDQLLVEYHNRFQMLYQRMILQEFRNLNFKQDVCDQLDNKILNGFSVIPEIEQILLRFPKLNKAIKKVNALPCWPVFGLAMINIIE